MVEHNLLYELEYKVNNLRHSILSQIEYDDLTIKEMLDLGIDDTSIIINDEYYDLGYKWYVEDTKTKEEHFGYESAYFGELNEKQLNCHIKYVDYEYKEDYGYYLNVIVKLANDEDKKYFMESE